MALTNNDLSKIKQIVKEQVSSEVTPVKKQLKKIDSKLDTTIKLFDTDYLNLKKRVEIVEEKVGIPRPLF